MIATASLLSIFIIVRINVEEGPTLSQASWPLIC